MFRITVFNYLGSGLEILRSQIPWTGQISCLGPKFQIPVIGYFSLCPWSLIIFVISQNQDVILTGLAVDPALCPIPWVQISSDPGPDLIPAPDAWHRLAPRRNQEYSWRGSDQWSVREWRAEAEDSRGHKPGIFRQITGRYQASSGNLMWIDDF